MTQTSKDDLIGLVPAAGRGTRLGLPYPKELYPIIVDNRYKPVAQHVLENLVAAGARHVVVVVNETKHQLMAYFGDGRRFGCELSYVVQESHSVGTTPSGGLAEALDAGYHLTRGKTVVFGMADTIVQPSDAFRALVDESHAQADLVLGLFETDQPQKFGMVEMEDGGRVRRIIDKPAESELTSMWGLHPLAAALHRIPARATRSRDGPRFRGHPECRNRRRHARRRCRRTLRQLP